MLQPMEKDGETMNVHPSCVAAHQAIGWVAFGDMVADEQPKPKSKAEKAE